MRFLIRHRMADEATRKFVAPLGRAALGIIVWTLLADSLQTMSYELRKAWADAVRRDAPRAIMDYAEVRGEEVDAGVVMQALRGARLLGETPEEARN